MKVKKTCLSVRKDDRIYMQYAVNDAVQYSGRKTKPVHAHIAGESYIVAVRDSSTV